MVSTTTAASAATSRPRLLTLAEVADHLQVTTRTIRRLVSDGELPALRIGAHGRVLRFKEQDVDRLLHPVGAASSGDRDLAGFISQSAAIVKGGN